MKPLNNRNLAQALKILKRHLRRFDVPAVGKIARRYSPFRVLISCILSLRTKDRVTAEASARLFRHAATPRGIARLPVPVIEKAIYPVGFYRTKARTIRDLCRTLLEEYGGKVPDTIEGLLKLKGVGRKTANLVVTEGFGKPGICVDTHVHRITNRWGYVRTGNPHETEFALRGKLPRRYWMKINEWLVTFGQNTCLPVSPRCSVCPLQGLCPKIGVVRHR